ncbi:MAG: hypothetical protein Q9187_006436, partial [Circinaria calcarea]
GEEIVAGEEMLYYRIQGGFPRKPPPVDLYLTNLDMMPLPNGLSTDPYNLFRFCEYAVALLNHLVTAHTPDYQELALGMDHASNQISDTNQKVS